MSNLPISPLNVQNFSGGFTENYVDGDSNLGQKMENFLLVKVGERGKLITRPGCEIFDADYYQIPPGSQRIGTLINYDNDSTLLAHSSKRIYFIDGGWQTLTGPNTADLFSTNSTSNVLSHTQWNKHLLVGSDSFDAPLKIYRDSAGDLQVRTAGLPDLASTPTITGAGSGNRYVYAFAYFYSYTVDTVTFEDEGPVTESSPVNRTAAISGGATQSISGIPVLANSSATNYDTANIKVRIYRTKAGFTEFYYLGEVTNGTTVFTDGVDDATLELNALLYRTGGVVNNDPPPKAKIIHTVGDFTYYAHFKDGSEIHENKFRQSIAGDPDSVPIDFEKEVDGKITGFSSVSSTPIALCEKGIYRFDGYFDEFGRGSITHLRISDTAGCVGPLSVVQTLEGVFWIGFDGVYFTDGYRVQRLNDHWPARQAQIVGSATKRGRIVGNYDKAARVIFWTIQDDDSSADNDMLLVLDLNFGIRQESTFLTWSGGSDFSPSAICFFEDKLIRADRRGYLFRHSAEQLTDLKVNTLTNPSTWDARTIVYDYKSCAFDFGNPMVRKFVPWIMISAKNRTNLSLQIISNNDDNRKTAELVPIRFRGNIEWGDEEVVWGDADLVWNYEGLIEERRRFPAKSLRCSYKQVEFTNAHVTVTNSDTLGQATIAGSGASKTVTLDSAADSDWPLNSVDYYIAFEPDDYATEYLVTGRTDDTLTVLDSNGQMPPAGSYKWLLRGQPKGELLYLLSYTIHVAYLTPTQQTYNGATGANS